MASLTLPGWTGGGPGETDARAGTGTGARAGTGPGGAPPDVDGLVDRVRAWLVAVEGALSPYRPDSDLCRWRSGTLPLDECSPLLAEVVDDVAALQRFTKGCFHPYDRRGRFDPTGYVKGWAVERAVGILAAAGVGDASLGVGGDVQMIGRAPGGRPWHVAVVDPADRCRIVAVLGAVEGTDRFAVATSGDAERGEHIWSPMSVRWPTARTVSSALASVTVVGPDLRLADAFTTAVWAGARDRPLTAAWTWLAGSGYEALAVDRSGRVTTTPGMGAHLVRPAA